MNLKRAVWKVFSIHGDELKFTLPLFVLYLLSGSFFAVGQIFTETIFLKAYGAKGLSKFFVYNGIALIFVGIIYNSLFLRLSLKKGFMILISIFAFLIFSSTFLSTDRYRWLPFYLYMANYLFTFFIDIHFFNYAFQFLSLRSSKRLLPFIMGGGKLGGIGASLLVFTIFSRDISASGIYVWAVNGSILIIPVILINLFADPRGLRKGVRRREFVTNQGIFERIVRKLKISYSSPIFTYSVFAIFLMAVVNQVSEYYFAKIFNNAFETKNQLASFLSIYTFVADFITLLLQIFLTARIIDLLGVKKSNMVYPGSFLTFMSLCAFFPNLIVGILLRFFRKNISLIIRTPIFNTIMASSPKDRMAEVKSVISGIINPLGMIVGGGVIMLIYKKFSVLEGFSVSILLGVLYLMVTLFQNRAYISTIKNRLSSDAMQRDESELDYSDYAKLLTEKEDIEKNLDVLELLFNEHPSTDLLQALYPYFGILSPKTRLNIVSLIKTERIESRREILLLALRDSRIHIRLTALSLLEGYPLNVRSSLLKNYPSDASRGESYAIEILLSDGRTVGDSGLDIDGYVMNKLMEIREGVLDKGVDPIEFIAFIQVLPYQYFLKYLVEIALATRDIRLLNCLIPYADKLTREQARRILYIFRESSLDYLISFSAMADKLSEIDRVMLLDYRDDISEEAIERIFRFDERTKNIIIKRLFSDKSYLQKSNYLNYILNLGIKPEKEMVEYINYEIISIIDILEIRNSLSADGLSVDSAHGLIFKFLKIGLGNEIDLHKHLILKAIAILTGFKIDEIYESNLLLKDDDLNSYILEYIESSGKHTKQALFVFEDQEITSDIITLVDAELEARLQESLMKTKRFIPEIAGIMGFCISLLEGEESIHRIADQSFKGVYSSDVKEELEMLSLIEKIVFLKENSLFNELKIDELIHIAKITREMEIPQNRIVIRDGETGDELFIIVDGEVEVYKEDRVLARLGRESCIGELSIIDKEPRSATVKTIKKTRVLSINRRDFLLTLRENPSISINIMRIIAGRLRERIS